MLIIVVKEDCAACKSKNSVVGVVGILDKHKQFTDHDQPVFDSEHCADSVWTHPGFQMDSCIRITCNVCMAQNAIDICGIEMTCTGKLKNKIESWVPESNGIMIEIGKDELCDGGFVCKNIKACLLETD